MNKKQFWQRLNKERLIAALKEPKNLERVLDSKISVVFLLTGHIGIIKEYVEFYKRHHRYVFLHIEKIGGITCDRDGLGFVANYICPAGIISTKSNMIKLAKKLNLMTIQRLFLIDTDATKHGLGLINANQPDAVEVMPARMPGLIAQVKNQTSVPVITGGLLENRIQMKEALKAGAVAVSTGSPKLWKEKLVNGGD